MPAPIVSWYDSTNTTQQTSWNVGTVDAGTTSPATTFLIWNNRAGGTAVSDMTSCTITTKDSSGGDTGSLVVDKWVAVQVLSTGEASATTIGGTTGTHAIGAGGTAPAQTIQGAVNDGNVATSATLNNFAKASLTVTPPAVASAGLVNFLVRVSYQYV